MCFSRSLERFIPGHVAVLVSESFILSPVIFCDTRFCTEGYSTWRCGLNQSIAEIKREEVVKARKHRYIISCRTRNVNKVMFPVVGILLAIVVIFTAASIIKHQSSNITQTETR